MCTSIDKSKIFEAGRLKNYEKAWREITSDNQILDIVLHCHIHFYDNLHPVRKELKRTLMFNRIEEKIIDKEICNLLELKVIQEVNNSDDQYLSPIFTVPKKDGEHRMILNLKDLNQNIEYYHFKMDTFETALKLIKPNCFMASIDVRHAYYSVPIAHEDRKFLRFKWKNAIFQYTCLPNGISCAPRYFTKLLKPVYSTLRKMGHLNFGYIDDSLLIGDSRKECLENVNDTNWLEKVDNVILECKSLYKKEQVSLTELAKVIGILVSVFPAVEFGQLHYRNLELQKIYALRMSHGDFNAKTKVTEAMKLQLKWWFDYIKDQYRIINHGNPDKIITTDASTQGWGSVSMSFEIGGRWNETESKQHINYLELLAAFYGLRAFCKDDEGIHVGLKMDNTCAIAYINNMGRIRSKVCNELATNIWLWCIQRGIWLSASYVHTSQNVADIESRKFNENIEWKLNSNVFRIVTEKLGVPNFDLFASRLNTQHMHHGNQIQDVKL